MISRLRRENISPGEQAAAKLALQLTDDDVSFGAAPSAEELALLCDGQPLKHFSHQRYQEVLSHLHADDELLARWLEVAELQEPESTKSTKSNVLDVLARRFLDFRVSAAMGAAALIVLGFFVTLKPGEHGILPSPAHRAQPYAESADWTVQVNLAAGAILALEKLSEAERALVLDGGAQPSAPTAPYPEHPIARQYGAMLTQARLRCRQEEPMSIQQAQRLHALQSALGLAIDADCWTLTRQWRQALR